MNNQFSKCKLHEKHDRLTASTIFGEMTVFDEEKYRDFPTVYCNGRDIISYVLIHEDCWERRLYESPVRQILENGNRNNIVIDVGAQIGWYTRMASELGYTVYSFEGVGENIDLLKLNSPKAIARQVWFDKDLTETFTTDKTIEFMKIDIEGAEQYATRYFEPILDKVNNILMEVSPCFNDSYPALLDSLKNRFEIMEHTGEPFDFNYDFPQKDLWLRKRQ